MPKRKCKFTDDLEKRYPSFKKGNFPWEVTCGICNSTLSIANKGARDIEEHMTTEKHKRNIRNQINKTSSNNLVIKTEKKLVAAAEGTLAFHTITHHLSYTLDCTGIQHTKIYTCGIAEAQTSTTKTEAIINYVIGPHSVSEALTNLQEISCIGLLTDYSNHDRIKLLPICIQYFDFKNGGIQTKVIELTDISEEKSETITDTVISVLNEKGLSSKCIAFNGNYCNTNFGGHSRIEDNVYSRMKLQMSNTLIEIGCPIHVLNNTVHYGTDTQPFDIELLVLKIYNYFSIYTVRTDSVKDFCSLAEIEYEKLLCNTRTRWLSLFPAIDRVLKLYEPLKLYFLSQENTPAILQKFFQSDISECYMLMVHSLMSVFHTNIQAFERNSNSLLEIMEILKLVHNILQERLKSKFIPLRICEILNRCRGNGLSQEADEFIENMQLLYDSCIEYLESWLEPFEEFSCFQWMNLKEVPVWTSVLPSLIYVQEKGIIVDNAKFFDQWSCLKSFIENQLKDEKFEDNTLAHEIWSHYFNQCKKKEMYSELLKLTEFVFAIPCHNASIEKLFSLVQNQFTKENINTIESLKGIILVQYNFQNLNCYSFHNYLQLKPALLEEIEKL